MTITEEAVYFPSDGEILFGILTRPDNPNGTAVTLLGGGGHLTLTHRNRTFVRLARSLAVEGYQVMRFDYHGFGDATGTVTEVVLTEPFVDDLMAALTVQETAGAREHILIGTCFGARTALAAATAIANLRAVVAVSPPVLDLAGSDLRAEHLGAGGVAARIVQPRMWLRALRPEHRAHYRGVLRARLTKGPAGVPRRGSVSTMVAEPLRALASAGIPTLLLYGKGDPYYEDFRLSGLVDLVQFDLQILDGAVHSLPTVEIQDALLVLIPEWLRATVGADPRGSISG